MNNITLMKVLEMTEDIMNYKYNYDWIDSETITIKDEYIDEYDQYYLAFWNLINNTNYLTKDEIKYK